MGRGAKSEGKNRTLSGRDVKGREEFAKLKEKQGSGGWMGRSYHHPITLAFEKVNCAKENTPCTRVFIAASFTTAQSWKQPRGSSTDARVRDTVRPNGGMLLSRKRE